MAIGPTSPSVTTSSKKTGAEMQGQPGLTRLQIWLTSHLALSLALSLCFLTTGLWLARSTVVEQDIGAMLPEGPGSPREAGRRDDAARDRGRGQGRPARVDPVRACACSRRCSTCGACRTCYSEQDPDEIFRRAPVSLEK